MSSFPEDMWAALSCFACLVGLIVCVEGCSGDKDDPVLADVAGQRITVADVERAWERWGRLLEKPAKADLLTILVDKQMMVVEAQRRGLDRRPAVVEGLRGVERKELADRLYEMEVLDKVSASEAEMRRYFEESGMASIREVRARHIMVKTQEEAAEIREALIEGADFAELAQERSLDEASAEKGGDLGYWREGAMVGPTAKAAFALKVGELSQPVQDGTGQYHLIQVMNQRSVPYEAQKGKIQNVLLRKERLKRRKVFFDELKQRFQLRAVGETVSLLVRESRFCFDRLPEVAQEYQEKVLLKYDGGEVTVRTYLDWVEEARSARRARPDSTYIVQFAENKALETWIAPEAARRAGLDRAPDLKAHLRWEKEDLSVKELRQAAVVERVLTEARIEAFYQSHKETYRDSAEILVECALLQEQADAEQVFRAVQEGQDMAQVMANGVRGRHYPLFEGKWPNYSVFSVSAFGERRENVKRIAQVARMHDVGDLVLPFRVQYRLEGKDVEGYIVMWVRKRRAARLRPLSDPAVRADVVFRLEREWKAEIEQRFERFMDQLRTTYASEVVLYEQNMKFISSK